MNYFSIKSSIDVKVIGNYPQVKDYEYLCNVWDEPRFIGQIEFVKIDFEPITANTILYPKSNTTDLIAAEGMGFSRKLLVSTKLKSIIEKNRQSGLQFFKSSVFQNKTEVGNYWISNVYETNMEYINYKNSEVSLMEYFNELEKLKINSYSEFLNKEKEIEEIGYPKNIIIKKLSLVSKIEEDFFMLRYVEGGVKYIVSETLKKEIEDAGCTGIEFQPVELSYNEWTSPGGERERVYGNA